MNNHAGRFLLSFFLCFFCLSLCSAQEKWTLQQCIQHALENNLQVKQAQLQTKGAELQLTQQKAQVLPSVNGFAAHNYNFGQRIDPFTNQFANQKVRSNSFGLNADLLLFNGLQQVNSIRQSSAELQATKLEADGVKNDIALSVATAYLQVLFAGELSRTAEQQFFQTQSQVTRMAKLVEAGSAARGNLLDVEAQLATEELQVVTAQNQLAIALLTLKQLLEIPADQPFDIQQPDIDVTEEKVPGTSGQIYQSALQNQPVIKSSELRIISAHRGMAAARGSYLPRLSLNASYGTGYSGLQQRPVGSPLFDGYDTVGVTSGSEHVLIPNYSLSYETIPFRQQIENNVNKTIGFTLTVPIFNSLATRSAVSRSKIAEANAIITHDINQRQLQKNIEQAYTDAVASLKKYQAAARSNKALEEAFKYSEQRFNVGLLNSSDYNLAKTRLNKAASDLLQAKYEYVFKLKVLDFYQGRPLTF